MKITFKKEPRLTGLAAVGYSRQSVEIKVDGKVCGHISAPNWQTEDGLWGVGFMVYKNPDKTRVDNCAWKWIRIVQRFDSELMAREWVLVNLENLSRRFTLRFEGEN